LRATLSLYGYCEGDPINKVDPSGFSSWWVLAKHRVSAGEVRLQRINAGILWGLGVGFSAVGLAISGGTLAVPKSVGVAVSGGGLGVSLASLPRRTLRHGDMFVTYISKTARYSPLNTIRQGSRESYLASRRIDFFEGGTRRVSSRGAFSLRLTPRNQVRNYRPGMRPRGSTVRVSKPRVRFSGCWCMR